MKTSSAVSAAATVLLCGALLALCPLTTIGQPGRAGSGVGQDPRSGSAEHVAHLLHLEPGFRQPGARLLVPLTLLDGSGRPLSPPSPGSLECFLDGRPAAALDLAEAIPTALLIISDLALEPTGAWAPGAILEPGSPHWLGIWDASQDPMRHLRTGPAAGPLLPGQALPAPDAPRLWDAVLAGIGELALLQDAPMRRVLLIVGDLRQEAASAHPMAACLEAARDLAIPVYGAVLERADGRAVDRLAYLAEGSGGSLLRAATTASAAARDGLELILAARGLILADPGLSLPLPVTVQDADGGLQAHTIVVARLRGRYTPGPALVTAGLVLAASAAGLLGWRQWRRRPIGYLVSLDPANPWQRAIPAAGLSIGRAADNGLTMDERNVSKHHALVRWRRGQVQLIDLRSTNGTQVGGRLVRTAALDDGDLIVFGDAVTVRFRQRTT